MKESSVAKWLEIEDIIEHGILLLNQVNRSKRGKKSAVKTFFSHPSRSEKIGRKMLRLILQSGFYYKKLF